MSNAFADLIELLDDIESEKSTMSVNEYMRKMEYLLDAVTQAFEARVSALEARVTTHEQNYP